jgi:hypothetical protein
MFPSQDARNITVLGVFLNFSGCGISSNTLLIYLFVCVYLQVDLLISALGFMLMIYMCVAAINKKIP